METFVTMIVITAVIILGAFLIHRLNSQHSDRIAAFHYGRSGMPVAGPAPSGSRKARGWARVTGTDRHRYRRDDGGRGQSHPRRPHTP
ncbi:hypothetical protein [Streptomyces europaeiscabiei]|uniref:hypothetical protein n=1 Tax=Streptomyces europaeiscabiei TaxID=146819 RepID=UPI0029BE1018|nr:hypothetical protein [Streptomyces europaeiscabiei]MDX3584955.1 hypothetical protein [Streptomyces europaeiscabiei]MDX3612571.1 hypothetical protein [Streptomyces europaeiscabiei]